MSGLTIVISKLSVCVMNSLRRLRKIIIAVLYRGEGRLCPVCGKSSRRFRSFGIELRTDAQCVHCGALERNRLLWVFITRKTDLFEGKPKRMLHIAPELCLEDKFRECLGANYLSADLSNPRAMIKMNIMDIPYPDESFDVIYCSHVLEHVRDDRRAMRELCRVLKKDGWAIILVPITADKTFEDFSIVDPAERLKVFGQEDHVRRYGSDYIDRLREAGFKVTVNKVGDLVDDERAATMGLTHASGEIYYCVRSCDD